MKAAPGMIDHPQWLDEHLYPFQSRFVEIDGNRIHYIDEGTGPILLFLHPGIGWSFMYRDIIKELRSRFRSINFNLLLEYTLSSLTKKPRQHFSAREKQAYRGPMADRAVRRYPHDLFASA